MAAQIAKRTEKIPDDLQPGVLGMNLDFSHGRGFLAADEQRLADWLSLDKLRMEIPNLSFPFDASEGLSQFKNRRCQLTEIEFTIFSEGLERLFRRAIERLELYDYFSLHFVDGAIHIIVRLKGKEDGIFVSTKAYPVQPTVETGDLLHLSFYDYQVYGPIEEPARRIVVNFITQLLETDLLSPPGRGDSYTVDIAGDIISFRILKLLGLGIFPKIGWKLPDLSSIRIDEIEISPGRLRFRAVSDREKSKPEPVDQIHSREKKRALAAYEAKDLFSTGDEYLYDGRLAAALNQYEKYQRTYGLHPELVSRRLDCLLARSKSDAMVEIESLCRQLGEDHPVSLRARMNLAASSGERTEQVKYGKKLLKRLDGDDKRGEKILVLFTLADVLREDKPEAAAEYLNEILNITPRSQLALRMLRDIYVDLEDHNELENVLKQLASVVGESRELINIYMELAEHLMHREGALGTEEAILYLEEALEVDSNIPAVYIKLAECYLTNNDPAKAIRLYETASNLYEGDGDEFNAALTEIEISAIWDRELDDPEQAALHSKTALNRVDFSEITSRKLQKVVPALYYSAEIAERNDESTNAVKCWTQLIEAGRLLEQYNRNVYSIEATFCDFEIAFDNPNELIEKASVRLGKLQMARQRYNAAAQHFRNALKRGAGDNVFKKLEEIYRDTGRVDDLIELLEKRIDESDDGSIRKQATQKIIELLDALGRDEQANDYREFLKQFDREKSSEIPDSRSPDKKYEKANKRRSGSSDQKVQNQPRTDDVDESTGEMSQESEPSEPETESDELSEQDIETFREKYEQLVTQRTDLNPDGDPDESQPFKRKRTKQLARTNKDADHTDLLEKLQKARNEGAGPQQIVDLLTQIIETYKSAPDSIDIHEKRFARYNYEAGELLYYELEEADRAKEFFENAREADPEGVGQEQTLLTTLERIYEQEEDTRGRIQILEDQLEGADSEEMKQTYRLLLAQTCWNKLDDEARAKDWLEPALEQNPKHEGAHRLLAEISRSNDDYEDLANHLETILEASSGLDAVELERELGEIRLEKLDEAEQAVEHLQNVLEASPADSEASELLKKAYLTLERWDEYFEALNKEIKLLIGSWNGNLRVAKSLDNLQTNSEELEAPVADICSDAAFIAQTELEDLELAHALWGKVIELVPQQVEALQKRIELARQLEKYEALADDLEEVADLLLDSEAKAEKLLEASQIRRQQLDQAELANKLEERAENLL